MYHCIFCKFDSAVGLVWNPPPFSGDIGNKDTSRVGNLLPYPSRVSVLTHIQSCWYRLYWKHRVSNRDLLFLPCLFNYIYSPLMVKWKGRILQTVIKDNYSSHDLWKINSWQVMTFMNFMFHLFTTSPFVLFLFLWFVFLEFETKHNAFVCI